MSILKRLARGNKSGSVKQNKATGKFIGSKILHGRPEVSDQVYIERWTSVYDDKQNVDPFPIKGKNGRPDTDGIIIHPKNPNPAYKGKVVVVLNGQKGNFKNNIKDLAKKANEHGIPFVAFNYSDKASCLQDHVDDTRAAMSMVKAFGYAESDSDFLLYGESYGNVVAAGVIQDTWGENLPPANDQASSENSAGKKSHLFKNAGWGLDAQEIYTRMPNEAKSGITAVCQDEHGNPTATDGVFGTKIMIKDPTVTVMTTPNKDAHNVQLNALHGKGKSGDQALSESISKAFDSKTSNKNGPSWFMSRGPKKLSSAFRSIVKTFAGEKLDKLQEVKEKASSKFKRAKTVEPEPPKPVTEHGPSGNSKAAKLLGEQGAPTEESSQQEEQQISSKAAKRSGMGGN